MFAALSFTPMSAFAPGTLIAVGVVIVGLMAIYAIWWLIFRMGEGRFIADRGHVNRSPRPAAERGTPRRPSQTVG